jgi:hypothetical protein
VSGGTCKRLNDLLRDQFKGGFGKDIDQTLQARGRELWIIGIDTRQRRLTDVCGTIGPQQMTAINSRGFHDNDAGFRIDAHHVFPTIGKEVDVFLLNTEHFEKPDSFLVSLVVHELAHYLEQIGEAPDPSEGDGANAAAILVSLTGNVRRRHTLVWAQFLAIAARRIVKGGHSSQKTIREFLEAAIPPYDRNGSISIRE